MEYIVQRDRYFSMSEPLVRGFEMKKTNVLIEQVGNDILKAETSLPDCDHQQLHRALATWTSNPPWLLND
jgi:hypothetical protein